MHAIEAPLAKMTVAAAALVLGAFAAPKPRIAHYDTHRLVLHAPVQPHALYLTHWSNGNVLELPLDVSHLQPMQFGIRAHISDGCEWLGIERLVPENEQRFFYSYDERILSCEPGATPALKTPRVGYVTIE
jgi:hypothetical protein